MLPFDVSIDLVAVGFPCYLDQGFPLPIVNEQDGKVDCVLVVGGRPVVVVIEDVDKQI